MYFDVVKGMRLEKASTLLSSSFALGQAIGLLLAYLAATKPIYVLEISSALFAIAAFTSYLVMPEVAIIKERVDYYSRLLYSILLFRA